MREAYTQFKAFALVGMLSTAVHFIVLFMLAELFAMYAVWASSLGYLSGGATNYVLNYRRTFRSIVPHRIAILRFVTVAAAGFFVNGLLIQLLTASLRMHYLVSQMIATSVVLVWNFLANRHWTFSARALDKHTKRNMAQP